MIRSGRGILGPWQPWRRRRALRVAVSHAERPFHTGQPAVHLAYLPGHAFDRPAQGFNAVGQDDRLLQRLEDLGEDAHPPALVEVLAFLAERGLVAFGLPRAGFKDPSAASARC